MANNQNPTAQSGGHPLAEGMEIFDADGEQVGILKSHEAYNGYLLVHHGRLFGHDFYLPQILTTRIGAGGIHLSIRKDESQQTYARTSPPPTIPQAGAFGTHTARGQVSPVPPGDPTPDVLQRTASIVPPHPGADVPGAACKEAPDSVPAADGNATHQSAQRAVQLTIGDLFPDVELPDQTNSPVRLSHFMRPSPLDERLGFGEGYPLIVQFFRGFFCPRDQQQMRQYVLFQQELAVNYAKLVAISAHPPLVNAAFRAGLGATWPFLSDEPRTLIRALGILDETEGEYAYRAQPYTFILRPDLRVHAIYSGWWFIGRPTLEELRHDLRAIMQTRADYHYAAYDTPQVRAIRIPQQEWASGAPPLGASELPVASGVVKWFDRDAGIGMIARDGSGDEVFFSFTAIPGEGYRTLDAGTLVRFELVESGTGLSARNIQRADR